jgi:O-antigen/teichoic acid export membrane protein
MTLKSLFRTVQIEQFFQRILTSGYRFFFKKEPSAKIHDFVKNFGYLALAEIIAGTIGFPIKILVGRFLGPEEYGKYSLVITLTQFFVIPMLLGLSTATLKYLPSHPEKKSQIIGLVSGLALSTTICSTIFFLCTHTVWTHLFGISEDIFRWTIAFSLSYVAYFIFEGFQRGLARYSLLFWASIINTTVLLIIFLVLLFGFHQNTYQTFVSANIGAYVFSCGVFLVYIFRDKPARIFDKALYKKILPYAGWATIGSLTGFLINNTDRLFLNSFVSVYWVGVYSAYANASVFLIGRFFYLFISVYFPSIAKEQNKDGILRTVRKIYAITVIPVFLVSFFSILGIIWLFGSEFPIRLDFALIFSINNCLMILYQLYMWLINAQGNRGIRTTTNIMIVNSFVNLALNYAFIQWWGAIGVTLSTVVVNLVFIFYYRRQLVLYTERGYFNE